MVLANGGQQVTGLLSIGSINSSSMSSPPANVNYNAGNDPDNEDVPMIDKAQAVERLKQARKRRAQQLKKWGQYEKQLEKDALKKKKAAAAASAAAAAAGDADSRSRRVMFSQNLLLLEAASRGDLEEVAALLARGVSPDSANEDGLTALHQCCIDDNEPMCRLLLQYHARVDAVDSELWTPLHAAATCGHANICKVLIENGGNLLAVNADGNMPYDICEDEYTLTFIESEMAKRGITQEQIDDMRCERERQTVEDLKQWVSDGGDIDVIVDPRNGATILHVAAANGWVEVCSYALSQGASVDTEDRDGWQPIHVAACWGYVDEVQLLVDYGAEPDARTRGGDTIFDLCEDEELRRRLSEIKSEAEQRTRFQRAHTHSQKSGSGHAALTVTNSSPNASASRRNGSLRMRSSFSHGSPGNSANANGAVAVANTNRSSIRRSSLRRSSMRQKAQLAQREAAADGDLRQQAAEALAIANGTQPLPTTDSADDLDSDANPVVRTAGAEATAAGNEPAADFSLSSRTYDSTLAMARDGSAAAMPNGKYLPETSTTASEMQKQNSANSFNRGSTQSNNKVSVEKKSALKNSGPSSLRSANMDGHGMLHDLDGEQDGGSHKASGKRCCTVS